MGSMHLDPCALVMEKRCFVSLCGPSCKQYACPPVVVKHFKIGVKSFTEIESHDWYPFCGCEQASGCYMFFRVHVEKYGLPWPGFSSRSAFISKVVMHSYYLSASPGDSMIAIQVTTSIEACTVMFDISKTMLPHVSFAS